MKLLQTLALLGLYVWLLAYGLFSVAVGITAAMLEMIYHTWRGE